MWHTFVLHYTDTPAYDTVGTVCLRIEVPRSFKSGCLPFERVSHESCMRLVQISVYLDVPGFVYSLRRLCVVPQLGTPVQL